MTATINVNGAVVFWRAGVCARQPLLDGLTALGYARHAPDARSHYAALTSALKRVYGQLGSSDVRYLVRGLAKCEGCEVLKEVVRSAEQGGNQYAREDVVVATADGELLACQREDAVRAAFSIEKGRLHPAQVTDSLVGLLSALHGVTLRPNGGVYWLPEGAMPMWQTLQQVFERASVDGGTRLYSVRVAYDSDAMRAVVDAITAEVESAADAMAAELAETGDDVLGSRALETRKSRAMDLRAKVLEYEALLGTSLEALRARLETVETRAATLIIEASAAKLAEQQGKGGDVSAMFGAR